MVPPAVQRRDPRRIAMTCTAAPCPLLWCGDIPLVGESAVAIESAVARGVLRHRVVEAEVHVHGSIAEREQENLAANLGRQVREEDTLLLSVAWHRV